MAHQLARDFHWNIEFIPIDREKFLEELENGVYDIAMSGIALTPDRLEKVVFSTPHLDTTAALIVEDFRKDEFATIEKVRKMKKLKIAIPSGSRTFKEGINNIYPNAEVVMLEDPVDFYEKNFPNLDAMLATAEGGSAWTLLYPKFHAVVIKPETHKIPLAYPIAKGDRELESLISKWIYLEKDSPTFRKRYDYWIMGIGAEEKKPRWSVLRNVLGWGLEAEEETTKKTDDEGSS
jgi:ABC-type amino acid transport substrate-binding protein